MSGVVRIGIGVVLVAGVVISGGSSSPTLAAYLASSTAASLAFSVGLSLALGGVASALAGRPRVPSQAVTGNIRGSTETHLVVFGERRVGGKIIQLGTAGTRGAELYLGIAHSVVHPGGCEGITGAYFNDVYLPVGDLGALDGTTDVTGGDLAGQANLAFYRGTNSQTADSRSVAASVDISTDYRRGICWTRFLLRRSDDAEDFQAAYPGGIPTVNVVLRGWRCYDPRLDSTAGGSGSHRVTLPATWAWTRNPALCAATYTIASRSDGGCGFDAATVDFASVAAAANICEELITTPAGDQPRFQCDLVLDTRDSWASNLQKILDCMGGFAVRVGGVRKFYAAAYRSPTVTIDETWLRGGVSVTPKTPVDQLANTIYATFPDETSGYKSTDTPRYAISAAVTADGAELETALSFEGVVRPYGAQYLAQISLRRSRRQESIELPVNLRGLDVECGETITLNLAELGISSAVYRVSEWRWDGEAPLLRLRADAAADYAPDTFTTPLVPGSLTSTDETVGTPQSLIATGLIDGVALSWRNPAGTQVPDPIIALYVVERSPEFVNTFAEIARVNAFSYVDRTAVLGSTYDYRVRAANTRGQTGTASNIATASLLQPGGGGSAELANPGFEQGPVGWAFGSGWTAIQQVQTGVSFGVPVYSNKARTGIWSGIHTGSANTSAFNGAAASINAGDLVTARAWWYQDSPPPTLGSTGTGQGFIRINWLDAVGALISTETSIGSYGAVPSGGFGSTPQWLRTELVGVVAPTGAEFARLELVAEYAIRVDDCELTVAPVANLDQMPDGIARVALNFDEVIGGVPALSVAGSGKKLGDQRNMPAIASASGRSRWSGQTISYSVPTGTADPVSVTVSVSAADLLIGDATVSYGAMSIMVSRPRPAPGTMYQLYVDDPDFTGGTLTLQATTNGEDLFAADSRIWVGQIALSVPSSGSATGGGTGGGGNGGVIP